MKKNAKIFLGTVILIVVVFLYQKFNSQEEASQTQGMNVSVSANNAIVLNQDTSINSQIDGDGLTGLSILDQESSKTEFSEDFSRDALLVETGSMNESVSANWWLNSGAYLSISKGLGETVQGELSKQDEWRIKYKDYNSSETDDGYHPQNIFRLVTRYQWKNFLQESYFKINRYILSQDKARSESNGLLLFNRYQDGDNLYYTGLRVDGTVVIKKKVKGIYYTMAQEPLYPGKYDRKSKPNLLPIEAWIGLQSEVRDNPNGTVSIKVYRDKDRSGDWQLILTAIDDGKKYGGAAIKNEGYAGIRTDFMDVEFDDYKIEELK